jgi:formate hydrogenlyase subunit 6/NADH:ubiquinone oxidoreductase subunit I
MYSIDAGTCIKCGACKVFCPSLPVSIDVDAVTGDYSVNQATCLGCGVCKDVCPVGAVSEIS